MSVNVKDLGVTYRKIYYWKKIGILPKSFNVRTSSLSELIYLALIGEMVNKWGSAKIFKELDIVGSNDLEFFKYLESENCHLFVCYSGIKDRLSSGSRVFGYFLLGNGYELDERMSNVNGSSCVVIPLKEPRERALHYYQNRHDKR